MMSLQYLRHILRALMRRYAAALIAIICAGTPLLIATPCHAAFRRSCYALSQFTLLLLLPCDSPCSIRHTPMIEFDDAPHE